MSMELDRFIAGRAKLTIAVAVLLLANYDAHADLFVSGGSVPSNLPPAGQILQFKTDGTRSVFAAGLSDPRGMAFDLGGNLFEADARNGNIYKYSPQGIRTTFATGISSPRGIAFDANGNLFVEEGIMQGSIFKFSPSGIRSTFLRENQFDLEDIAVAPNGNLYVSTTFGTIWKYTPSGSGSVLATSLGHSFGIAVDGDSNVFVAGGSVEKKIYKITPDRVKSVFASNVNDSHDLAFDRTGNLFVTDIAGSQILRFTPDGTQSTFATGVANPQYLIFGIPEPSSVALAAIGFIALTVCRLRRRK